ncbi:MAG: hypothetical protein HRU18_01545 [Pseudoalteromonas sp.]|uniref:hypothetical protein n=1 Tax=Pseudoalteromonas sp. TaxID=53249 RepID=UPI001D33AA82|nr:hypothetical protein [Pseudoalteromonas sp.]NRA76865.1 hypothetical protein [Pseudoalteromonas sp.]
MSLKLRQVKKGMKSGGKTKPNTYTPPRFLYRDANSYAELPIIPKTLDLIPKKLKLGKNDKTAVADLDFVGVIESEFPKRKKPKGSKSKDVGPSYRVTIKFENVKFSKVKDDKVYTEALEWKGQTVYYKKPTLAKNSAKIRCQCADFRHKFETPIARAGSLAYGTPRPYKRKTEDPTDANMLKWENGELEQKPRPFANPTDKLGYCKHIHSLLVYLIDDAKLVKQA